MQIIDIVHELPKHATKRWAARATPVDCLCIHHSATAPTVSIEQIAQYHVYNKDMPGIQYHYCILADGTIYQTELDEAFVWHGNDFNTGLGVCLLGDFTSVHPTAAQLAAARWLLAEKRREYGELRLVGHCEAPRASTECPGRTWPEWKGKLEESEEVKTVTTASKLGIFFQGNPELGTEATELIRNSEIEWVKGIDVDRWPTRAFDIFPAQLVMARFWIGGDSIEEQYVLRGATGADRYADLLSSRWVAAYAQGVRDVVGPNEMHPAPDTIAQHIAFWQRWAERVVAAGLHPWFGSFGVGWPDIGQIVAYADVARYCAEHNGGVEVHEYAAPSVMDGDGWYTLRYRRTIAELGFEVPVFIGECGIDWGVVPGEKNTGWKSHTSYVYPEQYGIAQGLMTEDRYWAQVSAYDDALLEDDYVVAATPFVTCPESSWRTFDFGGSLIKRVVAKHATKFDDPVDDIEQAIGNAIQAHVIPLNPNAALEKAGMALGLLPASDEVRDVAGYVAQAFREPGQEQWQQIAYCADGDWGNVRWFRWEN